MKKRKGFEFDKHVGDMLEYLAELKNFSEKQVLENLISEEAFRIAYDPGATVGTENHVQTLEELAIASDAQLTHLNLKKTIFEYLLSIFENPRASDQMMVGKEIVKKIDIENKLTEVDRLLKEYKSNLNQLKEYSTRAEIIAKKIKPALPELDTYILSGNTLDQVENPIIMEALEQVQYLSSNTTMLDNALEQAESMGKRLENEYRPIIEKALEQLNEFKRKMEQCDIKIYGINS